MSDPGRLGECKSKLATYATHASLNGRKKAARVLKRVEYNNDHLLSYCVGPANGGIVVPVPFQFAFNTARHDARRLFQLFGVGAGSAGPGAKDATADQAFRVQGLFAASLSCTRRHFFSTMVAVHHVNISDIAWLGAQQHSAQRSSNSCTCAWSATEGGKGGGIGAPSKLTNCCANYLWHHACSAWRHTPEGRPYRLHYHQHPSLPAKSMIKATLSGITKPFLQVGA